MKTYTVTMVICAALAIGVSAQAQNQAGAQGSAAAGAQSSVSATDGEAKQADASVAGGTELNATLYRPVDASKSKPGDEVTATTAQDVKSGGQVVIPKGSKLIGRVTKAQPRSKGGSSSGGSVAGSADSQLGIVFERAVLKDGREIPLNATIQAVAAARSAASAGANSMDASTAGSSGGGGLVGGVTGTATGTVGTVAGAGGAVSSTVGGTVSSSAGATGGLNTAGRLTSGSKGVFGLEGLEVTSAATSGAGGSVITSKSRNVRLDGGTQLLLVSGANATGSGGGDSSGVTGAANAAGSVSGAAKQTGDSGAEKTPERPDPTDKR